MPSRESPRCRPKRRSPPRAPAWLFVLALGCGGPPPPEPPPALDDEEGALVSVAGIALPRMPVDLEPDDLGDGWRATEAALTMPTPRPPDGEEWEVEVWADESLAAWMTRRAEAVARAQRALEPFRAGAREESAVASFLLGLAYSRFALDLRGIPTPAGYDAHPARAEAFRVALETAAQPLFQRALDAFGSCAGTAAGAPAYGLGAWRERCDREARLIEPLLDAPARDEAPSP